MRALNLVADRKLELADAVPRLPRPPGPGEVQISVKAVALNHIDLWGFRGMAFAKRKLPLVVGAEAAGEIAAVGPDVTALRAGDPVVMYGALTCGTCRACREGRDNLCENVAGIMGFHVDGFAREMVNLPARLAIPVPPGIALRDAACAPIAFSTVEHMLFDNARLEAGRDHAGACRRLGDRHRRDPDGEGGSAAPSSRRSATTSKAAKAKALGADHVINYRTERFEHEVRKLTKQKGVDVVFEHVGADTFNGSLLSLKRGGRLVTCGSTSGPTTTHQPDAAVSAAVPHLRLVRRLDAQHQRRASPRWPGPPAGDRHRSRRWTISRAASSGWKAARCSARSSSRSKALIRSICDLSFASSKLRAFPRKRESSAIELGPRFPLGRADVGRSHRPKEIHRV